MGSCISSNVEVAKDYLTTKLSTGQPYQKYTPVRAVDKKIAQAAVGIELVDDETEIENIFNEI